MDWMKKLTVHLYSITILTSCSQTQSIGCPDGAIEWVDLLKIDDVTYDHLERISNLSLEIRFGILEKVGGSEYEQD